jgi:hypothetical protein
MKPITAVMAITGAMGVGGAVVWIASGQSSLPRATEWLWLGAFVVSCLPLLLLALDAIYRFLRALQNGR